MRDDATGREIRTAMADIFISYSQKDRERVAPLVEALSAEGYDVWWDPKIRAGQPMDELIETTLEQVRCVVGVWSSTSVSSSWVRAESGWAYDRGVFVSVRIDDAAPLPVRFYNVHTPSLAGWDGSRTAAAYQSLVRDIRALAGGPKPRHGGGKVGLAPESHPPRVARQAVSSSPFERRPEFSRFRDPLRDGGQGPEMLVLPAGRFWMGSPDDEPGHDDDEGPRHEVAIPSAFALSVTPVTFADFDHFAEATGRTVPADAGWGRGNRPVINVSWVDAVAYAAWLSDQTGKPYRLPSEAEWEYACRAGTETAWSFGQQETGVGEHAWYSANANNQTQPVGNKTPNSWGLYDMHGNVLEWVQDCFHRSYEGSPKDGSAWEPSAGEEESLRVLRGGSWYHHAAYLRSALRYRNSADYRNFYVSFRLAQDL